MAGGKYNTRRRPDMRSIYRAAQEVARSRNAGYPDMENVISAEIGAHVLESTVRWPSRRTISRGALGAILQRAGATLDNAIEMLPPAPEEAAVEL